MKFCKLDIKKATVNTVLQQAIYEAIVSKTTGRYKYEIIDDNYTIKITGKRSTNPKSPYKIADELVSRINSYKPDILRVVKTREDDQSPILLEVYVNPDYINQKFDSLPEEQKNHVNVDLSRDINFFNGDNSLMEQERKWDSDEDPIMYSIKQHIKPGVEELFNENPELANIGTKEQYSQYLDTIFPNSQVKNIVYRGGEKNNVKLFQYWTNNKAEAYMYAKANITKGGNITERNPLESINKVALDYFDTKYGKDTYSTLSLNEYSLEPDDYMIDFDKNGDAFVKEEYVELLDKQKKDYLTKPFILEKLSKKDKELFENIRTVVSLYNYVKIESESDLMKQYDDTDYIYNIGKYKKARKYVDDNLDFKKIRDDIGEITTAILNITNPYKEELVQEDLENDRDAYRNGHDGAFLMGGDHFLVKSNTEQIHILSSKVDIQGFKDFINNNQNTNEDTSKIFYQLAPDSTRKELNQELTRFVKDILNKMGISTRTFEEYLKDFNRKNPDQQMDMVAFSDMFNRIIAYNEKTQDGTTLSEEMWHFIIDMMWDSPEVKEIRELKDEDGNLVFKKSGIWERESLDYYKIYSQTISNKKELDEKVEKEIIAKLLAQNLYDNFQGEEGFLGRFKMIIRNIYNKIIGRFIGKIRRANIKTKDVNDELNNVLNKLNLQLRYGQLYDNAVTGSQNIKKTNNITKDNGDLEDRYKIPITKDLFSHRVLVVAIRTLKDKLQHLKDTKTGLYNEELNKNWNKYAKILKEHIGLTSFTDIHDLKTSLDEYQNGNPSEVNTEKGIMIEDAFNKMRQLIILSSEDRRKINEIASIQRRVTSLQKQYAANQFQFGIFAFFFGNDGEVEINNNQLNEDIKESSEGVITDLNKVLTRISEIQNDNLELTPVEFQKIVNAYSEYEPIIKRLNDIFNNGYNFNELTVEQNEKLKKTMDSLSRYQLTDINDFLVNKSTAANLKEMERYALETNTMNPALEARIKSGNGNIGSIGIARLMFGSAVNSMEDWISMFSRKIMDIQNKVTRKSHDEAQELIGSIRDEISNANDSDMRSIMEQDENGVPTGYYINPYNVGKHSKAFEKAAKDIVDAMDVRAKKIGFTQGFPSNRDARHKMWSGHYLPNFDIKVFNALKSEILKYKKNEIPEQLAKNWEKIKAEKIAYDNGIANLALLKIEHDKLWANWFSKNTMPHPDAEQIINDRRKNMSESEYNLWYKKSVKVVKDMEGNEIGRYYKGELAIPSDGRVIDVKTFNPYGELITTKVQTIDYKNPKYNSLSAKNKKIVDTLVKYKTKAALKLPINFTYEFAMRLPQRSTSKSDILYLIIGKKYVKENVKEWVSELFDNKIDNQLFGEEINGVQIPRPRIQYVHKLDDPKLISQDLIMSTIMFMRMSINYEENMLAIPELEGMKQMAKYNKIKQNRDALIPDPNNIMEWVSKGASVISNFGTSENEDDKLIAKMQNMLNTHVYGIKYANPTETTRKLAPFLEKMRTYIRDLRLLGSVASAIKGMVSAIVDTMGVSFINRYFDKKDLTFGVKEYLKESHSRIYQSSSILKTTKSEVLADSLGLVGSLERNTANNTRTRVWRMITKSVDYGNYVSADRNIKYPIMIAISNTLRYYNGKLYSQKDFPGTKEEYNKAVTFWNSVSVENGRIKYKDYVKESDINYFTNMVKSVAARMDGQLMDIDRGAVYNNAFLQFLTINTQFLYQQLDLFFSGQRYDYLLQRNEAGYGGTIARNFDRIFLPGLSRSFDEMTDAEKDAAKQIYTFMVTALILNTLAFILIAGYVDDDKDKDPFWKFLTYISLGSAMEHLGRYSAEDVLRYILAPTQGGEEGKNALAALMQLITCAFVAEETVGANSMYEGYSKTDQSVIRSIPLVRGAFETWAGGYVNEVLNKPATSIATSYSGKTKLVRDKIYNENWGVGLTWPSRAGGNFIGNQIAKRLGYEYQWKNLIQLPIKKEKENKGKKDNNKKDK